MASTRGWIGRGAIAGLIAAATVILWFLAIDMLAGEPFRTPAFLAGALFGGARPAFGAGSIALYTAVHVAVFVLIGIVTAAVVARLDAVPPVLLGIALGFLLFDLVFYGSVLATGVDIVRSLGWPALLAGNLIAGIVLMVTLTLLGVAAPVGWAQALESYGTIREGVTAGLIGAVLVAVWFLALDLLAGRPFFTPAALGSVLVGDAASAADVNVAAVPVIAYTVVHVFAFIITGLVAAAVFEAAERTSDAVLLGGVLLFFVFEAFSIGLLAIVSRWLLDVLSWWSIAAANLIAAAGMGVFLVRRHARLMHDFRTTEAEERLAGRPVLR